MQNDPNLALAKIDQPHLKPQRAFIREAECIGCTKCIQACPFDAILGAAKQMHTVLITECTGCELCITPCPVDCIELITLPKRDYDPTKARTRFYTRQKRLSRVAKPVVVTTDHKAYILAAVERVRRKRCRVD